MPVTEFASLALGPAYYLTHPCVTSFFQKLAKWQSEASGYPLFFYSPPASDEEIYLISGWASVSAHHTWIASDRNQELLRMAEEMLEVRDFLHLDVDFDEVFGRVIRPNGEGRSSLLWEVWRGEEDALKEVSRLKGRAFSVVAGQDAEGKRRELYLFSGMDAGEDGLQVGRVRRAMRTELCRVQF
ncbi:hypothetical protein CONPUDRAFT_134659 [Coniophora puteana RWD-64-598 SS2]|uniref:ABM domain-containing protein n=1 Tax=Coniophora puteana (strain RWD-64-598) TaxID=741705 RepID=A0A5M3N1G0_CONPW|nr:uncharacterized protein CONPUDRAFT_134659 [Coniophora puteana RWD-64-598 SS2]EIW84735.1 hypothetical protein CONPUDRAFT_134659 [Coniophora puteana RWD-64-598 SS2]